MGYAVCYEPAPHFAPDSHSHSVMLKSIDTPAVAQQIHTLIELKP